MITVTSVTHPEGDVREFSSFGRAYDYACELVELGFSPLLTENHGPTLEWDAIHDRARDEGY